MPTEGNLKIIRKSWKSQFLGPPRSIESEILKVDTTICFPGSSDTHSINGWDCVLITSFRLIRAHLVNDINAYQCEDT